MKCPDNSCGFRTKDQMKFCPECGTKLISDGDLVVICSGKTEEGLPCNAEINSSQKFCMNCGLKVDPQLFVITEDKCDKCGEIFRGAEAFCGECGLKRKLKPSLNETRQPERETEKSNNSSSCKMEGVEEARDDSVKAESDNLNNSSPSESEVVTRPPVKLEGANTDGADNTSFSQGVQETAMIDTSGVSDRENEMGKTNAQIVIDDNDDDDDDDFSNDKDAAPADCPELNRSGNINIIDETPDLVSTGNIQIIDESSGAPILNESTLLSSVDAIRISENSNSSFNSENENIDMTEDKHSTTKTSKRKGKSKEDMSKRLRTDSNTSDTDRNLTTSSESESNSTDLTEGQMAYQDKGNENKMTNKNRTETFQDTNSVRIQAEQGTDDITTFNVDKSLSINCNETSVLGNKKIELEQEALEEPTQVVSQPTAKQVFGEAQGWRDSNKTQSAKVSPTSSLFGSTSSKQAGNENDNDEMPESDDDCEIQEKPNEDSEQMKDLDKEKRNPKTTKSNRKKQKQKEKSDKKIEEQRKKNQKRTGTAQKAPETTRNNQQYTAQTNTKQENPEFKFNPETQKAVIKMSDESIGGNWKNDLELELCQRLTDEVCEMTYKLEVHEDKITLGSKIAYKYSVKEIKHKDGDKYSWEDYMKGGRTGKGFNRELSLLYKWKKQDVWHQYDGFIEKSNKGVFEYMKSFLTSRKIPVSRFDFAFETFIQGLIKSDTISTNNDILVQLEMLQHGLWVTYGLDGRMWSSEADFKKEIGPKIVACVLHDIETTKQTGEDESMMDKEQRINSVIGVILALKRMGLLFLEPEKRYLICKLMVIKPPKDGSLCEEIVLMEKLFPNCSDTVLKAIISLAQQITGTTKDPCWMYLMPWIHMLSRSVAPFEKPGLDLKHDKAGAKWWGISEIGEDYIDYFKGKSDDWQIPLEQHIDDLSPLFEMDYLLPRTIMASVELGNLERVIKTEKIPFEVCLAATLFYIRKSKPAVNWGWSQGYYSTFYSSVEIDPRYESKNEKIVAECTVTLLDYISSAKSLEKSDQTKMMWEVRYKIALQLLKESSGANRNKLYCNCALVALHSIAIFIHLHDDDSKKKKEAIEHLEKAAIDVGIWIEKWFCNWNVYMEDILMVWNSVITDGTASEDMKQKWDQIILNKLNNILTNRVITSAYLMKDFVHLYCRKVDIFKPAVQDLLSKTAFKVSNKDHHGPLVLHGHKEGNLKNSSQEGKEANDSQAIAKGYHLNYTSFDECERERFGRLLSNLYLDEWRKAVSEGHEDEDKRILNHVIKWPPFLQYLKIYSEDQAKLKLLSEECTTAIVQAVSSLQSRIEALLDGSITTECLNMVDSKESKFSEIAGVLKIHKNHTKRLIDTALQVRQKEIQAFRDQAELMTTFTSLCSQLSVDVSDVYQTLKKQRDIENHQVKEFCKPADISEGIILKDFQTTLCAFNVSEEVINILPELHVYNQSSTFISIWVKFCESHDLEVKTLDDVVTKIWYPAKQSCDDLAKRIENGSITFQLFEKLIGKIYKEDSNSMKTELQRLKINERVVKERLNQLFKYRQLGACVRGAKEILIFQREYKLDGDFKQIQVIVEHDQQVMEMKAFDDNVMKTCDVLKEVTENKTKCLDAFIKCQQLVKWLKKSMEKSGLKELKVFVDLAFMSAGDEPINIGRVQCLHAAVTGYAPLIFDLKQTAGYLELLEICRLVWKELETDEKLPQKLIDTNRHLEWLKDIKKAHGSVEVTSLVQSDAINSSGIYTVGTKAYPKKAEKKDILDLSSCIKLTVSEVEGKRQLRNYTYENLQDLQSRLMLVAGKAEKGTDSVDRFTSIFDSVTRLANVNIKLCAAGCVLFKEWTARFLCDKRKPVCAVLEFGAGEGAPTLKTRRRETEDLVEIVPKIAKFMETCLNDWIDHIKQKRKEYHHLNYFTIDQLVILQKELVKIGTEDQPTHWIYPLLSAVKKNCSPDDLVAAMRDTQQQIDGDQEMETDDEVENVEEEQAEESNEDEKREAFIRELLDAGYDEKLALKALKHVEPDQVTDGIVWCMNHEDMEDSDSDGPEDVKPSVMETTTTSLQNNPEKTFSGWSQSTTSIQSMISNNIQMLTGSKGNNTDSLLEDLKSLWNEFLVSISSNIKDYLSLEHLGMILRNLAERETGRIFRKLPPSFIEGAPNLIICPSGDVLSTALSLYMLEKDQPLPQPDEILTCTQHTTIDEVDIFWRRAIFGGGKKIHCLVNADLLDFDVSDAAERYLEQYIQETNYSVSADFRYRLVVICGSDNENRSRIVASLDKYRRQALPLIVPHLREYLAEKLQMKQPVNGVKPAAYVDFNKSTVRVVKSLRAGVGKTLYKSRRETDLQRLNGNRVKVGTVSIPLQEKQINLHYVISRLLEHTIKPGTTETKIFHIDVAHEVQIGVDYLLFNLLVLGCLMDKTGFVWRKSSTDLYLIETLPLMIHANNHRKDDSHYVHQMLNILPDMTCRSPQDSLDVYNGDQACYDNDQLFDQQQFESSIFQRPYQYLHRLDQKADLKTVRPERPEGTPQTCLQTLLRHCGVQDPSWSELHHFVWFLNTQLRDFERSDFVGVVAGEDLPGFAQFVLRFLIQMSRDFSTRSLKMSEESPGLRHEGERMEVTEEAEEGQDEGNTLEQYQLRRTWESSPHPYLFFNSDHISFTFLGFYIERASGNLIDQQTNQVLERGIMQQNLYDSLVRNFVPIQENFDGLPRHEKIQKMCNVMGIDMPHDPDDTYELTTDNVKKIMAIFMRFRCDIPVIIMGETGCGKTRLVKFMCGLQIPPGMEDGVQNMILMKVHGGTTNADIIRKVREAERIAQENVRNIGPHMYTVLFFDEANTTESIGLIKEIMVDKSMEGQKLSLSENLKMVAACNPYREHSAELIQKLEQAGLGYHVDAEDTVDKFGRVPMRRLVYRVQPLPQSLLPLVWDFGQLNTRVEDLYIRQMVKRYIRDGRLPSLPNLIEVVSAILTASQDYMRAQKDECSFVSLRDVDRVLSVMSWFYEQSQDNRRLYNDMDRLLCWEDDDDDENEEEEDEDEDDELDEAEEDMDTGRVLDDITRSLVLSVGVCYHACLKTRDEYREHIARHFREPCVLEGGADQIAEEINCCQYVFLKNVQLEKNIAKNMALKENVFMMVVCIELRIPLFLVGKPGSSKSLAKTIVSDAMQGNASRKELFRELKQAQMVSFQCSPLATPDGIVGTFKQCAQFQKDKDLDTFVSIVVLDEVGLAEDSPRMPLKTLHPLLEDGCQGDEKPEPYKKVAFIGISNWALDPAKMNRGILVQREVPDQEELENSARGICSTEDKVLKRIEPLIQPMCESYLQIFESASKNMREFFGLRDFYSLVKMVYAFAEKSKQKPTWYEMLHAVKRNFGGLEEDKVDPVKFFKQNLAQKVAIYDGRKKNDPDCSPGGLIEACLFERNKTQGESRYLLLLTENYGSLAILQQQILSNQKDIKPITIFGSSFRSDQEYTQVCRNINKIKVCMETGNTVVLLNLENLYESLYDALNQYYVYFGGERYVDLGLGTHRVKCPVHKNFRLIVVAEKQTVYKKFPIPLINRLEKHFLNINTMLSKEQQQLAKRLEDWAKQFARQHDTVIYHRQTRSETNKAKDVNVGDVFMGYHDDTCSAIILHVWKTAHNDSNQDEILNEGKALLLWVATPEAVVRLHKSALPAEEQRMCNEIYFHQQHHDSITDYLHQTLVVKKQQQLFVQVTTHSKLLATPHKKDISKVTNISMENIMLLDTLSSFDTEQQFSNKIQQHLQRPDMETASLLIIQCDSGDVNANLVACARYCVMDEYQKVREELKAPVHVVFIVQLPNVAGGCYTGFQCGVWRSVHIDDLLSGDELPDIEVMQQNSVSNLIEDAVKGQAPMDTNEISNISDASENMEWQDEDNERRQDEAMEGVESPRPSTSSADVSKGPLDIQDVIIGFETAGKKSGGRSLNVKDLILSCTQGALSMLKDKTENSQRTTERVALVLTLFHGKHLKGYEQFLQGMCSLIASLLKEKETKAYGAENWLKNEAAKPDNIRKAGTFRKSCVQVLESKISPILAGIIAHLDTNQNLDILEANQLPWKQDMWLSILNETEALQLRYSDLQSPKRQSDLQEVVVLTTGFEGQIFKASMPFSWLIKQKIEEILKTQMPETENEGQISLEEKIYFYVGVFEETTLGKVLVSYNNTGEDGNIAEEYLLDFVFMSYKALSKEEFELVCQSLRYLYGHMVQELGEGTLTQLLLCIHEAYRKLAPRLSYFHTMNIVWPECSAEIIKLKQARPDHIMFQEKEFTFSTLCLLIENLSPTKNELDQTEGRSKWLKKVHTFRPVVEKVLRVGGEDPSIYGAHSFQSIQRARFQETENLVDPSRSGRPCESTPWEDLFLKKTFNPFPDDKIIDSSNLKHVADNNSKYLWDRVMVMKLFLEHVCAVESEDKITVKHCMPLWKVLDDSANLKEIKTMDAIEKFLKGCNKKAIKEFLGKQETCCFCESELEGAPIVLPCGDLFCDECYQNIVSMGENTCLKCGQLIPQDWKPERQKERMIEKQKLADYQKRCNSFFMDVVSQLCFRDNKPPEDKVIDKLLTYITVQTKGTDTVRGRAVTKAMTIFNTGLDPNPVFRSFLLQLLMRTSEEEVMQNLAKYLGQAEMLLQQTNAEAKQEYIDLGILVIQCLEDILSQELNSTVEVDQGLKFIKRATRTIFSDKLSVEKLYGLAEARIGLAIAAKAIASIVQQHAQGSVDHGVRRLIEATENLCKNGHTDFPRVYLVKYMCRRYGIDVYQAVCQSQIRYLMWIGIQARNENQRVEISDRFVVCGDAYTGVRESLTKVVLGEDVQHLHQTLQGLRTAQSHMNVMLPLALYREITCSALYPLKQRKVTDKVVGILQNFIRNSEHIKQKDIPLRCLQNSIGLPTCQHLEVREGCDLRQQGVQCLITHFLMVLSQLTQDRTILQTLVDMYGSPQMYVNKYIPTMPQDDLEDVKEALLAARANPAFSGENPVFYRCPNGHPYVIGDCGRPATVGTCKECGSAIGGEGYQLRPGNIQHQGNDETQTGHILGPAGTRGRGPRPEREMTPLYCACVRLTIHMAMYLGATNDIQTVQQMIVPVINVRDVPEYLWRHILEDLNDLQRGLGRSIDDTFVLLHAMIDYMMRNHNKGNTTREEIRGLVSKTGRKEWEKAFCAQYLQPIFTDSDRILQTSNQRLVQDQRLGADPLLCLLYEIDTQQEQENPSHLELIPSVWRYRSPITLEHLRQEFDAKKASLGKRSKHLKVLDLFLKEEHYLRAIRCIPSILKLQRELFHKYQRKLDKAEASQITIGQIIRDKSAGEETSHLVEDFIIAWDICRDTLKQYLCPTELGGMLVQKVYCKKITENTAISILLPALKDEGLCAYALLDFLMRKQNDFLDKYINETTKTKKRYISTVQPMEVTSAHLISCDPQQDLLPIILANCQYSFEIGKGTKIEYDFRSLEHQIMDRFLFSKSKIDVGPVLKIDLMVYRTEFTNGEVFKKLEEKIPQDNLGSAVKTQICMELKTLPELCQSLYNLDITISFLKSVGGNPEDSLERFMDETLKMRQTIVSQKARQYCQFKHVQSLWLLLALEKSKKMAEQREPVESIFESVGPEFHEDLPGDIMTGYKEFMNALSVDKLSELVSTLHEYILLRVSIRENRDNEDYVDTTGYKLRDWLMEYSEERERQTLVAVLGDFPESILYKHCVNTWLASYRKLYRKQTGDRKF